MQPNSYFSVLFSGQTATTAAAAVDVRSFEDITIYLEGTGAIGAGVITIEEASETNYAGTWSSLGTVNGTSIADTSVAFHLTTSAYSAVRVRISTTITVGTVKATMVAH